jgi:hypothetical protein
MSPGDIIGRAMRERRSIEQACADLRAKYERQPTAALARMIERLEAEIAERRGAIASGPQSHR